MKSYILLFLLLLIACNPVEENKATNNSPIIEDQIHELDPAKSQNKEDDSTGGVEIELIKEPITPPLKIKLSSKQNTGIKKINTSIECKVSGGKKPYNYTWTGIECNKPKCNFNSNEIGKHEIICSVSDNNYNFTSSKIVLNVEKEKIKVDHLIAFGDSLTYGYGLNEPNNESWATLLNKEFYNSKLHNYAVSGATSWGVTEQHQKFTQENISGTILVFLWIGANDIAQFITIQDYENNLRRVSQDMISRNTTLILMNIPDVSKLQVADDIEGGVNDFLKDFGVAVEVKKIGQDLINKYNAAVTRVASELDIPMIDMYSHMEKYDNTQITSDGFHPNAIGHEKIYEKVKQELKEKYPKKKFV